MAITRSVKTERGYAVTGYDLYQEIAVGDRPPLGDGGRSAPWLPVVLQNKLDNEWFTLLAGRIVSIDRTLTNYDEYGNTYDAKKFASGFAPRIVPANSSGAAQPITYTANDVSYAVDVDDQTALVTAAGAASATLPANSPVGWMQGNVYSDAMRYVRINFEKQLAVTLVCDYYVEVATIGLSGQSSLAPGTLVKPYAGTGAGDLYQGCPTYFDPSSDSVDQIAGRVIMMAEIPYGTESRSRLDLLSPVRGLSLPGKDTTGKPKWLSMDQASYYCRINITLM